MKHQLLFLLCNTGILILAFSLGWYISFQKKVFSWIDFIWSSSFTLSVALIHIFQYFMEGHTTIGILDLLYITWSLRLSTHLYRRIKRHGEDERYVKLKRKWKVWYGLNFFILYQIEAILVSVLIIPLTLTYDSGSSFIKWSATALFCLAIVGESLADKQLANFKSQNKDRTKVCDIGLWKYSRHPNYFFEWLIWVSFGLYGLSSLEKWPAFIPAVIMYFMLTKVTGIPYAEASSLESKKENYILYQKRTHSFFPWLPKKNALIIALFTCMISTSAMASGETMQQQEKIRNVFETLRADNIQILDNFYASDTKFVDPIGTHTGIKSVKDYYKNLYQNVKEIHFKFNDMVSSGNTHVLVWTMTLKTEKLNGGNPISVEGTSHIKFNDHNLVVYHRDYFDMGEFIYENVPVLGWTVKKIKNRLKGE